MVWYTETSYQPEKRTQLNGRDTIVKLTEVKNNQDFVNLVTFLKKLKGEISASARIEKSSKRTASSG